MNDLARELADLRLRLDRNTAQMRKLPARLGVSGGAEAPQRVLVILNGNAIGNGAKGVLYAATVTLSAAPDIDADTDVPAGLGRAQLYTDGVLTGRVWIRHDRVANPVPLCAGDRVRAVSQLALSYGAGSITAYRWEW